MIEQSLASASYISGLFLWLVIPPFITGLLLKQYHRFRYQNKSLYPKEGTALYKKHYNVTYTLVIVGYFLYCIIRHITGIKPTYYDIFGVERSLVDRNLRTHFRQTVLHLHPDKNTDANPEHFLKIKQIYEILGNDATRSTYDCYGPDVMRSLSLSSTKSTLNDYILMALLHSGAFYVILGIFSSITVITGNRRGSFWRFVAILPVAAIELYIILRPHNFGVPTPSSYDNILFLGWFLRKWKNIPTFQKLAFLRQIFMYGNTAIGQIIGLYSEGNVDGQIKDLYSKIEAISKRYLSKESGYQLFSVMEPVAENEEMRELLRKRMGVLSAELQLFELVDANERPRTKKTN